MHCNEHWMLEYTYVLSTNLPEVLTKCIITVVLPEVVQKVCAYGEDLLNVREYYSNLVFSQRPVRTVCGDARLSKIYLHR